MCALVSGLVSPVFMHLVSPSYDPGTVKAEMLEMYTQEDMLILCVRLAVLLAVTLTVPVVLFPVSWGKVKGYGWMSREKKDGCLARRRRQE